MTLYSMKYIDASKKYHMKWIDLECHSEFEVINIFENVMVALHFSV